MTRPYLDFDPTYLEVVDAAGNPATAIESNTAVFSSATLNSVSNVAGQINFSASRYESPFLTGSFTAAAIRFRAKAAVANTEIVFAHSGARTSDLYKSGESINPVISSGTVSIRSSATSQRTFLPLILPSHY